MNDFDPLYLAKKSKTFCIFPWIHQYVGPQGDIKPCCVYDYQQELGNLKNNTLEEIWNNEKTKELRLTFLNGHQHPNCTRCNNRADIGDQFFNNFNKIFFKNNEEIQNIVASTLPNGTVKNHKLFYIDVRFNNLCNLKCRTCSPDFSTSWKSDYLKLYPSFKHPSNRTTNVGLSFPGKTEQQALEEIIPHLQHAEIIYFAGGEPLMQKEHFEVLNELVRIKNFDVEIRYNTNFSNFKLKNYGNVIDYWKKFTNISVNASLDGNYNRAEYWRNGTNWDLIVENRLLLKKECPHVKFGIAFTLAWPNALNLIEFHREWVTLDLVKPNLLTINPLDKPPYYSLKNIPDWKKHKLEEAFVDQIEWLKKFPNTGESISRYQNAINFMWSDLGKEHLHNTLRIFSKLTKKLDAIRNESFFNVFSEHEDIKKYLIENNLD